MSRPVPALALLTLLGAGPLAAQSPDLAIGLRAGTLGIGAEASLLVLPHLGIRGGANFFSHSFTRTESDVTFDATLAFKGVTGLVDLYPSAHGSFHFTGGVITAPAKVTGSGQPTGGTYTFNDHDYTAAEVGTVTGKATWPGLSPYAGIGWGSARGSGIGFVLDLGVAIGKPTIDLAATSAVPGSTLAQDVEAERVKIQDDVDKYAKVYPVLSLGLVIRL